MKKVFIFGLSVALVAGSVTSCKKTSKGKLSNDWKVTSWTSTETETDAGGVDVTTVSSTDGAAITVTSTYTPTGGTASTNTANGTINEMTYTISKDGTFESVQDVTFTQTFTGGSIVSNDKTTSTGTWNFLSSNKTEDFKKNERVVFHTLSETNASSDVQTVTGQPSTTTTSSSSNTWATGENSEIFVVVESKGKMLTMKSEGASTWSSTSGGSTSTSSGSSSTEFTLEQK